MHLIPGLPQTKFAGLKAWQWIGCVLLLIIGFLLHRLFTWIIELITRRLIQSEHVSKEFRIAIHKMAIPISYLFLVQVVDWLFPSLLLPAHIAYYFSLAFKIVEPIFLTVALYRFVDVLSLIMKKRAEQTETSLDDQLVPLFRKTAKVFVIGFGLVYLLNNLDFNLTALIAGVSIGGLAFALAAQDTIKNMFGSLMIFIDKPFQIGDLVSLEGTLGTIEEVGFRSTRIRTPANSLVTVPNGKVVDMVIDNLGLRNFRRFQTNISLTYDTPVDLIETYVSGLREIIQTHPKVEKDMCEIHLNDMASSSLNILMNIFFNVRTWSEELKVRHEIITEVIRLGEALKIRFAFHTQTLHVETFPDKTVPDFGYPLNTQSREEVMDNYLSEMRSRLVKGIGKTEDPFVD
jgi:MscS family membrane protein